MDKEVKNKGYCDSCKRLRILMPPAFKICKTCLRSYKYWEKDHLTKGSKLQEYFNNEVNYINNEYLSPQFYCESLFKNF